MSVDRPPITRAELFGGLTARRASTALFVIERRTAYLTLEARYAAAPAICDDMIATEEQAFLAALRTSREVPSAPTIQQIERCAPRWAHLVPRDTAARADLAHRLAAKYRFRQRDAPRLREALHVDDAAFRREYVDRFGQPFDEVGAGSLGARQRLRWTRHRWAARVDDMPPFWTAYSLTLTQTVGAGILALPIALAGIGPLPGIALLIALGALNVLTAVAVAESLARTGTVRWGGAHLGRVVAEHLGRGAGSVVSGTLVLFSVAVLVAYYVGLASTLTIATGLPAPVWAAGLFLCSAAFVWRGRLEATVVSALAVGAVNLVIVLALSAVALTRLDPGNLAHAELPFVGGRPLDGSVLGLVFGVVLLAYFGHTAVASGARGVLRRDPSGRSLIRGTGAAMTTAIAVYVLWVAAVGGAVGPARLARETGTALAPLSESVGRLVIVPGTVFVVLAMGMVALQFSIGLHHEMVGLLSRTGTWARSLGLLPLVAVFAVVEMLLLTGNESFTGALGLVGVVTAPLLIGVFPLLLLAATRRRGDQVPRGVVTWIGHRSVLWLGSTFYVAAVVAHGAVIWERPWERAAAGLTTLTVLLVIVAAVRTGAFRPAGTIELRRDAELDRHHLQVTTVGTPGHASVRARAASGDEEVRSVDGRADLPERTTALVMEVDLAGARELRCWLHEVEPTGTSTPLPATVSIRGAAEEVPVEHTDGVARAEVAGAAVTVTIDLEPPRPAGVGPPDVELPP
ncbi:aromatic amino acid transport family protein [Nitriliruptor alkaliphilus]|uniref:aromatic amino acid transport family protein n=1 Tax=Nitriliruptor alkaliphilus TaxID=427918 RepID=UPI000698D0EE|nr:aromatic amino acid transport family protein [Nitriliruptor alkaliphilus]